MSTDLFRISALPSDRRLALLFRFQVSVFRFQGQCFSDLTPETRNQNMQHNDTKNIARELAIRAITTCRFSRLCNGVKA